MLAFACCAFAGDADKKPAPPPTAAALLNEVLAQMPAEPIVISGRLWKGKYPRRVETNLRITARLDLGRDIAYASYSIKNYAGTALEALEDRRKAGENTTISYWKGDPPVKTALPDLRQKIQDMEITWLDLTLSFLWWHDGIMAGEDSARGRDCFLVDVKPPAGESANAGKIRLWIDEDARTLLQAEEYSPQGKAVRRMSVLSFKEIDDKWMVKDIEIQNLDNGVKTTLHVDDLKSAGKKDQKQIAGETR